jgi:hypothetical protein
MRKLWVKSGMSKYKDAIYEFVLRAEKNGPKCKRRWSIIRTDSILIYAEEHWTSKAKCQVCLAVPLRGIWNWEVWLHSLLGSELNVSQVISLTPRLPYPVEKAPLEPLNRGLDWPRKALDVLGRRQNSCLCRDKIRDSFAHSLVAILTALHSLPDWGGQI